MRSLLVLAAAALVVGCGEDAPCGPWIESPLDALHFGDVNLDADGDVTDLSTAPFEWVLLLESACDPSFGSPDLVIEAICVVGDGHNGDPSDLAFTVEGPEPADVAAGDLTAVRITYDPSSVNEDTDFDGVPDYDSVALVVQSNATNYPTLVVPMCARAIGEDAEPDAQPCTSPVSVAPGEVDLSLCGLDEGSM